MKSYKRTDIILQIILILIQPIGYALEIPVFFPGIIILGLVQLTSAVVHIRMGNQAWKSTLRKVYHWSLLVPVGFFLWAILQKPEDKYDMAGIEQMIYLLISSVILAIFYLTICIIEFRRLLKLN